MNKNVRLNRHLDMELMAPRQGSEKQLYIFNNHLKRLRVEGYERGPFPWEVFPLLAKNLEGKLKGDLKAAADDMMSDSGEWFALAFKVQKGVLLSYINPRGLVWHKNRYVKDKFSADAEEEFNIKGLPLHQEVHLARLDDVFAKRFYGQKFADLPQAMRARARVVLPAEGILWPLSLNYGFSIGSYNCCTGASRGIRK